MRFNSLFFPSFYLISIVLAGPGENRSQRAVRDSNYNVTESYNWAGAQLNGDDGSFYIVAATFVVPNVTGALGSGASVWVGLGNADGCSSIIQTGVDLVVGNNSPSYNPWFEWFPDPLEAVHNLTISTGDTIRLGIGLSSDKTFGTFLIDNFSNDQMVFMTFETGNRTPCTNHAEWVVEGLVPLANFGQVTFTNAVAFGPGDEVYGPQDSSILYKMLTHDGNTVAYVSSVGLDTVTINRGSG